MLECSILGLVQNVNFEDDEIVTRAVIRLSNGATIHATVDDEAADILVRLNVQTRGGHTVPSPRPEMPLSDAAEDPFLQTPAAEDSFGKPTIFGGTDDVLEDAPVAPTHAIAPPPLSPNAGVVELPNGKRVVRSRSVPADGSGYPIVQARGGVEAPTSPEPDDDGTSSI